MATNTKSALNEVMDYLESKGNANTVKIYEKHGATNGPMFGVRVGDLKPLQKKYKNNNDLAKALFATNNSDAMYLAALICEPKILEKETLEKWIAQAWWYMLSEYAVAWVVSDSRFALELIAKYMDDEDEKKSSCAWSALTSYISITPNEDIDMDLIKRYLAKAEKEVHSSKNRVRHTINHFIIAVGSYIPELNALALEIANRVGKVEVFMGDTACKVPYAPDYIAKVMAMGRLGKKRKTARC